MTLALLFAVMRGESARLAHRGDSGGCDRARRNKIAVRLIRLGEHSASGRLSRDAGQRSAVRILTEGGRYYARAPPFQCDMERVTAARVWIVSVRRQEGRGIALRNSRQRVEDRQYLLAQQRVLKYAAPPTMRSTACLPEFEVESQSSIAD